MNMPERISKYDIARVLGKGSMGVVYEGFDPDIQRKVAIKTLTPNIGDQSLIDEFHRRFKIEAQASARCMHPNIVTILEYGDISGMPFMVMEFIDGRPLDDILALSAPIRFNRAIKLFSQMLKGLNFAHQNGVVHRDIKPANIMVTNDDDIKIADFGIARLPVNSEVTQLGYTVGTPHYMPPEQEASSNVDGRADLFSLTVVFLELLSKVPVSSSVPHAALDPAGIYITPKVNMTQQIPHPFLPVLQKGLAVRPENRYESAREYAAALKQAVALLQGATGPGNAEAPVSAQPAALAPAANAEHKRKLREMESMLMNYIGPIGANLIEMHKDECASLYELAEAVADEIPEAEARKRFLSAWESDDEMTMMPRVDTARVQTTIKPVSGDVFGGDETVVMGAASAVQTAMREQSSLQLSRKEMNQLEQLFSEYVGPMAEMLLQEGIANSSDFDELVAFLLDAIPNDSEKTDFKMKVKEVAL